MAAATAPRAVLKRSGQDALPPMKSYPVANGVTIWHGTMVVLLGGFLQPATAALGLEGVGVADIPGISGANGNAQCIIGDGTSNQYNLCQVRAGIEGPFANSGGADAITAAARGQDAYFVDDSTLALTDGGGTRSWAGRIHDVITPSTSPYIAGGIMLQVGSRAAKHETQRNEMSMVLDLASLANAQVLDFGAMPWAGRILSMKLVAGKPATSGGAGSVTLTPGIAPSPGFVEAPVTGAANAGAITAGLAALAAQGQNNVNPVAITGGNLFNKGDKVQVIVSAVTAFTAGTATLIVEIG